MCSWRRTSAMRSAMSSPTPPLQCRPRTFLSCSHGPPLTRTTPPRPPPSPTKRAATETQVVSEPPFLDEDPEPEPPAKMPRATVKQRPVQLPRGTERTQGEPTRRLTAPGPGAQTELARTARAKRPSRLPYVRQEIVGVI